MEEYHRYHRHTPTSDYYIVKQAWAKFEVEVKVENFLGPK
jgi:hypothetical protein